MKIGIIGNGESRFNNNQKQFIKSLMKKLVSDNDIIVSGHSPVGGIDIWAEEVAGELGIRTDIKIPETKSWSIGYGYKARNLDIAKSSDKIYVIVSKTMPDGSPGPYGDCYHCKGARPQHVKSGACWTAIQAQKLGKECFWIIVDSNPDDSALPLPAALAYRRE